MTLKVRFYVSFMSAMSNLSDLPHDLLVVIAKQLKKLEDFVSFRCVSKSLRAVVKDEYFEGLRLRQRTPYLMLPVRGDGNADVRELYSLFEGESIVAPVTVTKFNTKQCFESLGWLLAVERDGSLSLLDPFSDTVIPLPHQSTFPGYEVVGTDEYMFIQRMVLSSRPSETSDFVLMVIFGNRRELAHWRLGDEAWNRIDAGKAYFNDVVYHGNGRFYAVSCLGPVWVFEFAGNDNNPEGRMIINCKPIVPDLKSLNPHYVEHPLLYYKYGIMNLYILKTVDDALLIITRISPNMCEDGSSYITTKFQVMEVDTTTRTWKEIHSLGRMAIFLGSNSTIAVDVSRFPGVIKPNHIYFTEDELEFHCGWSPKGAGKDIGIYNLETGTVEPIYPGETLFGRVSMPLWINPFF